VGDTYCSASITEARCDSSTEVLSHGEVGRDEEGEGVVGELHICVVVVWGVMCVVLCIVLCGVVVFCC
jgi:hypothetical protein